MGRFAHLCKGAMKHQMTLTIVYTVKNEVKRFPFFYPKTCLKRPLKKTKKLAFKTDYRLMQVKSIAECSKRAFCNTFDLH